VVSRNNHSAAISETRCPRITTVSPLPPLLFFADFISCPNLTDLQCKYNQAFHIFREHCFYIILFCTCDEALNYEYKSAGPVESVHNLHTKGQQKAWKSTLRCDTCVHRTTICKQQFRNFKFTYLKYNILKWFFTFSVICK